MFTDAEIFGALAPCDHVSRIRVMLKDKNKLTDPLEFLEYLQTIKTADIDNTVDAFNLYVANYRPLPSDPILIENMVKAIHPSHRYGVAKQLWKNSKNKSVDFARVLMKLIEEVNHAKWMIWCNEFEESGEEKTFEEDEPSDTESRAEGEGLFGSFGPGHSRNKRRRPVSSSHASTPKKQTLETF